MDAAPTYLALVSFFAHVALLASFVHASIVDVKTRFVPASSLAIPLAAWMAATISGYVANACPFSFSFASPYALRWAFESLLGGLLAAGASLASAYIVERRSGAMALGGGDVKLLAIAGLYLGPAGGLAMLGAACVFALVFQGFRAGTTAVARAVRDRFRFGKTFGALDASDRDAGRFLSAFRRPFAFVPFLTVALAAVLVFSFATAGVR